MTIRRVFILHHVHDLDGVEDVKLIGVYSSEASAEAARVRLSKQPGFVDHPVGFHLDPYELDEDHWTDGFLTVVHIEVAVQGSDATCVAQASRLASGLYRLWPDPAASAERWLFQPGQTVRCELRRGPDGVERLVAVDAVPE